MMPRKVRLSLSKYFASYVLRHIASNTLHCVQYQIALGGRYSRDFFNRYGDLRHIRRLRFWPLNKVLLEKYELNQQDADELTDFLVPILDFVPEKRPTAAQCLLHPWINAGPRLLEPSVPSDQNQVTEVVNSAKFTKEKDDREAVEVGVGNIAIHSDSQSIKDSPSGGKASKAVTISSSRQDVCFCIFHSQELFVILCSALL